MPKVHYVKRKLLRHQSLQLSWSIRTETKRKTNYQKASFPYTNDCNVTSSTPVHKEKSVRIEIKNENQSTPITKKNQNQEKKNLTNESSDCANIFNLTRKNNTLIHIKMGKVNHPAFELENPANPGEHSTLWVELLTTGMKICIFRYQIIKCIHHVQK
mmetsp:Transcript_34088/g.71755  ORF Transcript_34088/g.71755 Transcript_34088/m.71755 type:complete len:158 (-) Transcript_34088:8-481(-)